MIQRRVIAICCAVALVFPLLTSVAQTPMAEGPPPDEELTGLQQTVWRLYAPAGASEGSDVISIDEATPVADAAESQRLRSLSIAIREFDTAENAAAAYEDIRAGVEALADGMFQGGTQEISGERLPDLGDQAALVRVEHTSDSGRYWLEEVIVQRDEFVFLITADASVFAMVPGSEDTDASLPTAELAAAIVEEGTKSESEGAFGGDGTSTGGLWGFMPEEGNPLLRGLIPVQDTIIYPSPGA